MMRRLRDVIVSMSIGMLSFGVFVVVFAATALPAIAIVKDDDAVVTWAALGACVFLGWVAARAIHVRLSKRLRNTPEQP